MFGKKTSDIVKIDTLIGLKAVIDGGITGGGNYKIDGKINGDITVKGDVIIDKKAVVNGNIKCRNLIAGGTVSGNISAENITYRATAVINGDCSAGNMVIEEGASISGNCTVKKTTVAQSQEEEENEL